MSETRGVCPYCERIVTLRLDGHLRKHRMIPGNACEGSERRPRPGISVALSVAHFEQLRDERDAWRNQVVAVRGQQNRALRQADEARAALSRVADERQVCHRYGIKCAWDGCPNQHDDLACQGCFLIGGDS